MKTITILLIEDNTQDIRLIKEMLKEIRSFNYNLVSAATLKDGVNKLQKNNFDIILLDLNLPDSAGQQTFQKVIDCCKEIPVVLITGIEDEELSLKLIMEGAQDYIAKHSLNLAILGKAILYSIERQALLRNIILKNAQIDRIEKERIFLAKFPSQDPEPVLRVAINGKLLYINEAGIKLLPDWQLIINETIPFWLKDIIDPIFIEGTNIEFELAHREFIYSFYAVPFIEEGYINLYGRDITERKRTEEELILANKELVYQNEEKEKRAAELIVANKAFLQSEENFRRSISESPLGIRIISIEGETIYVNKAFLDIYGYNSLEEFRSIPAINRYTPESYVQHQIRKEKIKNGHEVFDYEISIISKTAEVRNLKVWRKEVLWNGVKHYLAFNLDITVQKQAVEALKESEESYRKLFENHSAVKIILDPDTGAILDANDAAAQYYGWTREELKHMKIYQINTLSPEEVNVEMERVRSERRIRFEFRHRRADGSIRDVEVFSSKIEIKGKDVLHSIIQDITERKQVEEAIIQSKKDWENTFDSITDMVTIHDQDYNIILANKAGKAMLKLPEIEKHLKLKCYSFYHGASEPPAGCPSCDCIKSGLRGVFELFEPYLNRYLEIRAIPRFDSNNQHAGMIHIVRDISERKQAEQALNNSQQELRKFATHLQNVREEEKIALAREIHDDLGQILVALKIDLGMFERKLSKGIEATTLEELLSKLNELSGQVDNTIKSARRIMNGLRPELIELLGFEEACKSYLFDFEETHQISSQFESTILNLDINLEQSVALFRILQEALTNVVKHAKATLVTVQLTNPAGKLVLQIIDNGVGFDENNKGRQDSYGMIGMKERVLLLEGELNITSKVGKGTSVRVEMPYQ